MKLFAFKSKKDEILSHWFGLVEQFEVSPQEFYSMIEKELSTRKIPGLEVSKVEYGEGGLLSEARIYLRLIRERLAFDICAAPFGNGFLFSCRSVYSPPIVRLWHILLLSAVLTVFPLLLIHFLGFSNGLSAFFWFWVAISLVFRNVGTLKFDDVDAALLKIPALGPFYERWIRVETYYRQDTRLVYLEMVPRLVRQLAEEITTHKGIKLLRQYHRAPVLSEFYRPLRPVTGDNPLP